MGRVRVLFVCLLGVTLTWPAHALTCKDLVAYRDGELASAIGKALDKNDKLNRSLKLIKAVQAEIASTRGTAVDVGRVRKIAVGAKAAADFMAAAFSWVPGSGLALKESSAAGTWAAKLLSGTSTTAVLISDDVYKTAFLNALADVNPLGATITGLNNLAENVADAKSSVQDNRATLDSIDSSLATAERQIKVIESKLKSEATKIELINTYKTQIDAECGSKK